MIRNLMLGWTALGVLLMALVGSSQPKEQAPPPPPAARKIPGITTEDRYSQACVDCHINYVEMKLDTRFGTLLKHWSEEVDAKLLAKTRAAAPTGMIVQGKHPTVATVLGDIPARCLACHGKNSKTAPPFARLLHSIHLSGGEANHFLTLFQGECTHCHKLDLATGNWTIPSAQEK